jgi:S1-C subfamily serine protease
VRQGNDVATAKIVGHGERILVPPGQALCQADLALVVLDQPVAGTRPLRISEDTIVTGERATAVGFGQTRDGGSAGKKLQRKDVAVIDDDDDELRVGEATCHGDSGGPLLDGSGQIVGVLSRGGPGCRGAVENIYTRPTAFSALIEAALADPE